MSSVAVEVKKPSEILGLVLRIFEATHWTHGYMAAIVPEGPAYRRLSEGHIDQKKLMMCSVGALRFAALAPIEHAMDEAWMVTNGFYLADDPVDANTSSADHIQSYLEAIAALVAVVDPYAYTVYMERYAEEQDPWLSIGRLESSVVGWNDGVRDREDGKDEVILPAFREAIAKLEEKEQS